jgi:hypothetical protein
VACTAEAVRGVTFSLDRAPAPSPVVRRNSGTRYVGSGNRTAARSWLAFQNGAKGREGNRLFRRRAEHSAHACLDAGEPRRVRWEIANSCPRRPDKMRRTGRVSARKRQEMRRGVANASGSPEATTSQPQFRQHQGAVLEGDALAAHCPAVAAGGDRGVLSFAAQREHEKRAAAGGHGGSLELAPAVAPLFELQVPLTSSRARMSVTLGTLRRGGDVLPVGTSELVRGGPVHGFQRCPGESDAAPQGHQVQPDFAGASLRFAPGARAGWICHVVAVAVFDALPRAPARASWRSAPRRTARRNRPRA